MITKSLATSINIGWIYSKASTKSLLILSSNVSIASFKLVMFCAVRVYPLSSAISLRASIILAWSPVHPCASNSSLPTLTSFNLLNSPSSASFNANIESSWLLPCLTNSEPYIAITSDKSPILSACKPYLYAVSSAFAPTTVISIFWYFFCKASS